MNCLKCGRTVPDQTLLCAECRQVRTAAPRRKPQLTQEERQERQLKKLRRQLRRSVRWLGLFVLATIAAAVVIVLGWRELQQRNSQFAAQTSRINSLETAISELEGKLEQANAMNDVLAQNVEQNQVALDAYEQFTELTPEEILNLQPTEATE